MVNHSTEFYCLPPNYPRLRQKLLSLKEQYPFIKLFHIGKSVLGRKIYAVGIGNLKSVNLMAGAFHGQEWLTASLLTRFTEHVCRTIAGEEQYGGIDFGSLLEQKGLLVVPMVNPDGVEIALGGSETAGYLQKKVRAMMNASPVLWQANARGVDLNHNFDAHFDLCKKSELEAGITGPCPSRYGGKLPLSEPETKAIVNTCCTFDVKCAFAFHSQGEEIYYEYGEDTPTASKYIAALMASYSGYQTALPTGTASHGGFKDWFVDKLHRPGFTLEIGRGVNPLPIEDLEPVYRKLKDALALAATV